MGLWQGILIVIGCIVIGLLVGLLLVRLFHRKKVKKYSFFNKEGDFTKTKATEFSVATTFSKGTTRSNGHEDSLEVLVKNHKNSVETVDQKNAPIIEKEGKTTQPAINWTELVTPTNQSTREEYQKPHEPLVAKEPVTANQKSTLLEGEPKKTAVLNVLKESGNINQKGIPVEKKQKKVSVSTAHKKPDVGIPKITPTVKEQKKSTKPVVQEADVTKLTEITSTEKQKESTKSGLPEPAIIEQKITPLVEKQSDIITELQANLIIASTPWADKLISFQTKCWNTSRGEFDPLLTTHHRELIQLYVDMGLANNIVWLATEIGHRSKELDDSYIKLCSGIADNIKKILL